MGLGLEVGLLAFLKVHDPEGFDIYQKQFEYLNLILEEQGLPIHNEPTTLKNTQKTWSCDMWGYTGLHNLRRIAAHLVFNNQLPGPIAENIRASQDNMLKKYYDSLSQQSSTSKWKQLFSKPIQLNLQFQHLLIHSDAEGFYLPVDFEDVIQNKAIFGGAVGSSYRLLNECNFLANKLELPLDMDHEAEALWDAADTPESGQELWQRYGVESFTCLRLIRASEVSIKLGAALVFV
ncbi:MAG: hypothetical protein KC449_09425 [Anaerolineales bacterium]|nr:hypothetical protein [Anaerolineales bacterium]